MVGNRGGISCLLVLFHVSIHGMECNRSAILCDRRYNEIAQINCHNATSYAPSLVQDQDRTVGQQLADGIRVFKIPLHYDYTDRLGYYYDIITLYLKELDKEIAVLQKDVDMRKEKVLLTLEEKQHEVQQFRRRIDETQHDIDAKKRWFNGLPRFALKGDSQFVRGIDYAATIAAWEIKKGVLIVSYESAMKVLEIAKATGEFFVEKDPHLHLLIARKKLLEQTAIPLTKDHGYRTVFACHALAKYELYSDFFGQLTKSAPEVLRPILDVILSPISALYKGGVHTMYGAKDDAGGFMPYPACSLDSSAMTLYDFLRIIKNFLDANPYEVVTILLNDFIANDAAVTDIFNQSGIVMYAYAHDRNLPWPTLRELITMNKRLIVMSDNGDDKKIYEPTWINNRKFYTRVWPNSYDFRSSDIFTNPATPLEVFGKFAYRDTEPPMNKILDITYAVTPGLAGNVKDATRINEFVHSSRHLNRIKDAAGHIPNFISVDFYTHPNNDIKRAIDELNVQGAT